MARWGGTRGTRTGGLDRRKPSLKRSRWHPRHVEAQSASLRRVYYDGPRCAAGAVGGSALHLVGLFDGVLVDDVGNEHGGSASLTVPSRGLRVTADRIPNSLISTACGLAMSVRLVSALHGSQVQRLWWKL